VLLHPEQISAKFDSWLLALQAALTFAVATLGINVVANFVSPAFDFANVFPRTIDFKKGGYIAAGIAGEGKPVQSVSYSVCSEPPCARWFSTRKGCSIGGSGFMAERMPVHTCKITRKGRKHWAGACHQPAAATPAAVIFGPISSFAQDI
jgi:hypothetical protein